MRESWCRRKGHWEEVDNSLCVTPAVRRHPSSLLYQHILIACTGTSGGKASLVACEQCSPTQAPPTAVTFPRDPMSPSLEDTHSPPQTLGAGVTPHRPSWFSCHHCSPLTTRLLPGCLHAPHALTSRCLRFASFQL